MRLQWLFIAGLAIGLFLSQSSAGERPTEAPLEKLVQAAPKIHLPELIAFDEAKLDRIYLAKLAAADPIHREDLRKAQEAWRNYYEADLVVGAIDTRGGSGQAVFAMERHTCISYGFESINSAPILSKVGAVFQK